MIAPVPGPSSTTVGSPVPGTAAAIAAAKAGELGATEAVCTGSRANARMNRTVSDAQICYHTTTLPDVGRSIAA